MELLIERTTHPAPTLPACLPTYLITAAAEEVGGTYEEGGVMEVKVGITAHHNGRFEFKVCRIAAPVEGQTWVQAEKAQMTQECFNQVWLYTCGWRSGWMQRQWVFNAVLRDCQRRA